MFNIHLGDGGLRVYKLELLMVGLNLAKFGTSTVVSKLDGEDGRIVLKAQVHYFLLILLIKVVMLLTAGLL
ncbi:hypothetical protein D8674_033537 [Pyrus ussuriensis x Pyrus communis]|uniref:Uncharacterized protein n=1 Tax=Pyrus ussuriensis x Pyrus communis TaxID=2448454 RepID=A0A5N5HRG7_9ROSA|nr:hypothetical protein D8674_033537 [Pyrus ussuriensis x Pyrus communis]